ncbi:MAG: GTP 3',8-cyclase [Desulfobacteraceae bacterium Eth-SRB2]|nr:MAG: GTP 3',8-cyclase [Desulfobacteraceae bacterium Eth-SRB2]
MPNSKLIDPCNRKLNYLRISITDRCNLRCIYCVPHGFIPKLPHKEILSYEEILHIVRISVGLGISKVRITGGEPLVRKGVYGFLKRLTKIEGLLDISLTTNGVFLKHNINKIKSAGIKRINISLDTLNRKKYRKITGYDFFDQVWEGIELAHKMGFDPVKLNVVPLKGINDDELTDIAALSIDYPFHIRFIEYMPMGTNQMESDHHLLFPEIKKRIDQFGKLIPVEKDMNDGPAERFKFKSAKGEIGFIRPISQHFCNTCNRLRLTASGQLRPCLMSDVQVDLKTPLRKGCSDAELAEVFLQAVRLKPLGHNLSGDHPVGVSAQMCAIGG